MMFSRHSGTYNCSPNAGIPSCNDGLLSLEFACRFVYLVSTVFGGDLRIDRVGTLHVGLSARLFHVLDWYLVAYIINLSTDFTKYAVALPEVN